MLQGYTTAAEQHPALTFLYALAWLGIAVFVSYVLLRRVSFAGTGRYYRRRPRYEIATSQNQIGVRSLWCLTPAEEEELLGRPAPE